MKKRILKISAAIFSALAIFFSVQGAENQWERVKDENGVVIYTRDVPGSAIKEVRAETMMQSSLSGIMAMFADTASFPRWVASCSKAELLKKTSTFERIVYTVTSLPWPVHDRDIALKSIIVQDKKTLTVTVELTGLPDYVPVKPGKERVKKVNGYWIFEPMGNGLLKVTHGIHSEPGGSIPAILVNNSIIDIPYDTIMNMKRILLQPPYKDAKFKEILEK